MNSKLILAIFVLINNISYKKIIALDATIIGYAVAADGAGGTTLSLIDALRDDLSLSFIPLSSKIDLTDISLPLQKIILNKRNDYGRVSMLCHGVSYANLPHYKFVPNSTIKIAYSMIETTKLPESWVKILNNYFDAIVVCDPYLVDMYKRSGIKKPIFMIPLILPIDQYLAEPLKSQKNKPFTFGMTGFYCYRKNHINLLKAFALEFGNNKDVALKIHARGGSNHYKNKVMELLKELKLSNVEVLNTKFDAHGYLQFMKSLDCYALLSYGEGFSVSPREAMALGIPCILSNNTAHKTICNTQLVYGVPSKEHIEIKDYLHFFGGEPLYGFDCKIEDIRFALRQMYTNYDKYLAKSNLSREWVKQYLPSNLKKTYVTLMKPKEVQLGSENSIIGDKLITTSRELYFKYKKL